MTPFDIISPFCTKVQWFAQKHFQHAALLAAKVIRAGEGLQKVCHATGIPPVLHMGACLDNSRILKVLANIVASGVCAVIGKPLPMNGRPALHNHLTEEIEAESGGKWAFEPDHVKAARMMIRHINEKRMGLKLKPMMYKQALKPVA